MTDTPPRKPPASITSRLILWLTVGTSLLWSLAVGVSVTESYRELNEAFDRVLSESARRILPLATDDVLEHEQDDGKAIERFIAGRQASFSYQLTNASGRIILRSHDAPNAPYAGAAGPGFHTVGHYRLFTETDDTTGLSITVAETTDERWETVIASTRTMFLPLIGLIPLNGLLIWLTVRRGMRPVAALGSDISARSDRRLEPLDTSAVPPELQPIAQSVTQLLERLGLALAAERAFAANSAHELRTPIAGALAQTQRMLAGTTVPDDRRRIRDLEATLKRLATLAEKLLQLSRIDAGLGAVDQPANLLPVVDLVIADCARGLDDPDQIRITRATDTSLTAAIDLDAFAIALRNLIDNALKHGPVDGKVDVLIEPGGLVRVINAGAIVPPDRLASLTRRFVRGQTRSLGAGLGLSIVETIARQSGATLSLQSPPPGRAEGFEAQLRLPHAMSAG